MCVHKLKEINDVRVCIKCGLTFPRGGRPFFDKEIVKCYQKGGKEHGGKNQ